MSSELLLAAKEAEGDDSLSFLDLSKTLSRAQSTRHQTNALNRSKLDWSGHQLQGREQELQTLEEGYQQILAGGNNDGKGSTGIAFVSGSAGTGKTALVNEAFGNAEGWLVSTKYDQLCPSECFATTISVFSQLCVRISEEASSTTVTLIAQELRKEMGNMMPDFLNSIPEAASLVGGDDELDSSDDSSASSNQCSLDLLKSMLRKLLECVSKYLQGDPIILFFDDIQWSDDVSLQLLDFLLGSHSISRLLIVVTYRHDIVKQSQRAISFCAQQQDQQQRVVATVRVQKLTQLDIANILVGLTKSRNVDDVLPLAQVILKRTDGIAFFVMEFIKSLETKKLLRFSIDSFRYEWDVEQIKADTDVCANIVDLIKVKLESLPENVAQIIKVSSILGPNFLVHDLATVVCSSESNTYDTMDTVLEALEYAQREGGFMEAIETRSGLRYKFVHDCLQKLAYDLVEDDKKAALHWQVGWALIQVDKTKHRFLAVEHLNTAVNMGAPNTLGPAVLAQLNLETANEARATYAFVPARLYLLAAIRILEPLDPWKNHYDMILEITTLLVRLDIGLGKFESAHDLILLCIDKAHTSVDVFPFSMSLVTVLQSKNQAKEGIDVGVKALGTLGCKIKAHVSKSRFIVKVLRMRSRLKKISNEQILALPDMQDMSTRLAVDGMSTLYKGMYQLGRHEEAFYLSLKQIELQLKFGLASADCFCMWGYACLSLKDREEAYRFGELGLQLHDRCSRESSFIVFYFKNAFFHALKNPLHDTIEPLWSAYNLGFMTGYDPIYAAAAGHIYAIYSFHCGFSLPTLHRTHKRIIAEMKRYEQDAVWAASGVVLQAIENFLGKADGDVTVLDGNVINETKLLAENTPEELQLTRRILLFLHKVILSVYFGRECPFAISEVYKLSNGQMKGQGFFPVPWGMYVALAGLRLAKAGKDKKKHMKKVRGIINELDAASKQGDVNAHVMNQLVLAELAVVKKEPAEIIKEKYDGAIALARRSGFVNIGGLGNALLAEYYINTGDKDWSDFYSCQAIRLYEQWSSEKLVRHVETMYEVKRGKRFLIVRDSSDKTSEDVLMHSSNFFDAHSGEFIRKVSVTETQSSSVDGGAKGLPPAQQPARYT